MLCKLQSSLLIGQCTGHVTRFLKSCDFRLGLISTPEILARYILAWTFHLLGHFGMCTFWSHEYSSRRFTVSKSPCDENAKKVNWNDHLQECPQGSQVNVPKCHGDEKSVPKCLCQNISSQNKHKHIDFVSGWPWLVKFLYNFLYTWSDLMFCFDSELFSQNFVWQLNNDRKSLNLYYQCLKSVSTVMT